MVAGVLAVSATQIGQYRHCLYVVSHDLATVFGMLTLWFFAVIACQPCSSSWAPLHLPPDHSSHSISNGDHRSFSCCRLRHQYVLSFPMPRDPDQSAAALPASACSAEHLGDFSSAIGLLAASFAAIVIARGTVWNFTGSFWARKKSRLLALSGLWAEFELAGRIELSWWIEKIIDDALPWIQPMTSFLTHALEDYKGT